MNKVIGFLSMTAVLLIAQNSGAVVLVTCESAKSIMNRAEDELCDHFVEASEDCFSKLNKRFILLEKRPANTPAKEMLSESNSVRESYEAGLVTVKSYLDQMGKDVCGDQRERVDVMIHELDTDLKDVQKRLSDLNAKGRR